MTPHHSTPMFTHLREQLDSEKWGHKIRALRQEKQWSQRDLADRLGVHSQTVSDIERGRNQMTLERLNRVLEALGYRAAVELSPLDEKTRADWGPIVATEPEIRRRIRLARQLAEKLADYLYAQYGVDDIYCFGSLVERGGANFRANSDVDLLVRGLKAAQLFDAESKLEIDVVESSPGYKELSFDIVRVEDVEVDPHHLVADGRAVFLPKPD